MRYEYKYYVPNIHFRKLKEVILPFLETDSFAVKTGGEYTVRSIYFDTPDFDLYHTKLEGFKHRYKVRLRGYNNGDEDSLVFMEIKRKYEHPILKNRASATFGDVMNMFRGMPVEKVMEGKPAHMTDNARRFFYQIYSHRMKPVVNVIYEREPYHSKFEDPDNNFRLTIDKNLRSSPYPDVADLFVDKRIQYALHNHFILEIKFNHYMPIWTKPLVAHMNLKRESASKYCICIDSHPDIDPDSRVDMLIKGGRF
jgi:hypothetical protein